MAEKKIRAFGFAPCVRTPYENAPSLRAGGSAVAAGSAGFSLANSIRPPVQIRYAAPAHFTKRNSCADASSSAPRLVAETAKYTAFAIKIPRLAPNPAD